MEPDGSIYAQAGVPGAKLARFAAMHNLGGAEFFAGIPGTVGGMLSMNAGCYGSETWEKVERAQVVTRGGEVLERTAADYHIAYRHVAPRTQGSGTGNRDFFAGAWFRFAPGDGEAARATIK